jgi:RHS repeat-associated protein
MLQLGARFYWPEIGRFISSCLRQIRRGGQDPIGDGMNWYAYVGNNPVVSTDPRGLRFRDWWRVPLEGLGAWIGDTLWPDMSEHSQGAGGGVAADDDCPTQGTDYVGPAMMVGETVAMGAVEAAKRPHEPGLGPRGQRRTDSWGHNRTGGRVPHPPFSETRCGSRGQSRRELQRYRRAQWPC